MTATSSGLPGIAALWLHDEAEAATAVAIQLRIHSLKATTIALDGPWSLLSWAHDDEVMRRRCGKGKVWIL